MKNINVCTECGNKDLCGKKAVSSCEHFDISYTRSEVFELLNQANEEEKNCILKAVESLYKIKLAY